MDIDIIGKLNDWTLFTYKNLLVLFSRKAGMYQTWKIYILSFSAESCWVSIIKGISSCSAKSSAHQGLKINQRYLPLFHNMSVKIYTNFFYLREVIISNVSSYLARLFGIIPITTRALILAQEVKMLWKSSNILSWDIWV